MTNSSAVTELPNMESAEMQSRYQFSIVSVLMACWCLTAVSCSGQTLNSPRAANGSSSKSVQPVPARLVKGKPEGLFYMQKMWIATRFLEKSCWYFAPDGKVFENPTSGFSPEDLAAHKGRKGTYKVSQGKMEVIWSDGQSESGELEIEKEGGFYWETGSFLPVEPFRAGKSIAGSYEGGTSFGGTGQSVIVSKSLRLDADGKYLMSGIATVSSTSDGTQARIGGENEQQGRWQLDGLVLHLTSANGTSSHHIAFPFDDEKTDIYPDRIFVGGTMYKRQP